jgi:hypothetical protein
LEHTVFSNRNAERDIHQRAQVTRAIVGTTTQV